ncbi:MAG: HAD family hydrolase [Sphingomonadales bacterium]|nr:MAG: HAD family hydrolase [Sphingomonadales bacterium]
MCQSARRDPRQLRAVDYLVRILNIIFDLDGTLIDSAQLTGAIIDQMLASRGAVTKADRALIRRMDAIGGEAMIAAVLGRHSSNPASEIEEFRKIHRTINVPADLPFPGVREALEKLTAAGIGMAICSNKPQFLCDKILGDLGLAQHFAIIVGSAPGRAKKPDPESAHLALSGLGGSPANTLYCGDSSVDLATARRAGLGATLVEWGYGTDEALALEPDTPLTKSMPALVETVLGHGA